MKYQILHGDNRETLKTLPDNSIDAIVTDPPYGIDFLGKSWDANTGAVETYQECLRVLKPGGHILAFSAARTYHHLAITLEQAGFEIRDQIMWIYSSGFPKSQDIGKSIDRAAGLKNELKDRGTNGTKGDKIVKNSPGSGTLCPGCGRDSNTRYACDKGQECGMVYKPQSEDAKAWAGWGTQLKPAHEPIALARKPIKGSIKDNVLKHGVGALNIDATRVPYASEQDKNAIDHKVPTAAWSGHTLQVDSYEKGEFVKVETNELGRFPSNVLGEIAEEYQKYFYCPKVSRRERHIGFDPNSQGVIIDSEVFGKTPVCLDCGLTRNGSTKHDGCDSTNIGFQERRTQRSTEIGNNHPTVKPIELMKYLIRLITPPGGIVLDPFSGSGSTGCAAVELGMTYIGCELDERYVEIATKRIEAWYEHCNPTMYNQLFEQAA